MCIPVDCGWAGKSIELHYYALHARVPRCTPVSIQFTNWLDPLAKILFAAHCLDFFCEIFATKSEWHWDNFYKEMKISGFSPICHFQSGAFFLKLQMSQDGRLWKDCDSKELRLACNLADTFPWAGDVKTAVVYEVEPGGGGCKVGKGVLQIYNFNGIIKSCGSIKCSTFCRCILPPKHQIWTGLHFRFWYFIKFWNSLQSWHINYILIQFV